MDGLAIILEVFKLFCIFENRHNINMNIAIIISVSEYADSQNNLPGCKKDGDLINNILVKTDKFDDILYIHDKLSSAQVKEKFTDFISENKTKKIDELFFYFTGHGEFIDNEFYYILSDYKQEKRKQTSLQNEEVDNLFRTLKPELVIKVIDACQSGKTYIKEAGVVTKYFQKTIDRFNKCYFLNSSLQDQNSFQSDNISDFTYSFIQSIKEHNTTEIRYKDIIDFISDEFENNPSQTPFFVVQADYTEKFSVLNESVKEYLNNLDFNLHSVNSEKSGDLSLLDRIKMDASEYLTKNQVVDLVNEIKQDVSELKLPEELNDIYNLEIAFQESYDGIVEKNVIGKWLDDNTHDFFASSKHKSVRKDRYTNPIGNLVNISAVQTSLFTHYNDNEYDWIRDGFEIEVEVPYKTIKFTLNSNFPNVESYTARVIFFISKKHIRFFYFITNFEIKNWDERTLNDNIEWFTTEHLMHDKENVMNGLKKIFNRLLEKAKADLEDKFNKSEAKKD